MQVNKENIIKWVKIGATIGLIFVVYKVIRKQIIKKKVLREFGDISTITNDKKGNKGGYSLPQEAKQDSLNVRAKAQKLYDAMKGWGNTDEKMIWDTLEPLSPEERKKVRTYFNTYFGERENLMEWFEDDLSGNDLQRARGYFN